MLQQIAQERLHQKLTEAAALLPLAQRTPAEFARRRDPLPPGAILRALLAAAEGKSLREACPEVHEMSERVARETGHVPGGPGRILLQTQTRDMSAAIGADGGYLVTANTVGPANTVAEALRLNSIRTPLAVATVPMPRGNSSIPRMAADATPVWLSSEAAQITEAQPTVAAIPMIPKSVGIYFEASHQWLKQATPDAQDFVLSSPAARLAAEGDRVLIQGDGVSGEPLGLVNAAGIGSASGATMTWAKAITTMKDVELADGIRTPSATAWVVAPDAALILRGRERASGSGYIMDDDRIAGRPVVVSNAVPSGVAIFGDWSQIVLGEWGVLELGVDPFGTSNANFSRGLVGIRAIWTIDTAVLQPASFSKLTAIS